MAGGSTLHPAGSTTGNGRAINCFGLDGTYKLSVIGAGVIAGETIQWETAPDEDYAGTWEPIGSPIVPVPDTVITSVYEGVLWWVRARFVDTIAAGSAHVRLQMPLSWS